MSGIVRANNAGQSGAVSNIETIDSDDYVDVSIDTAHIGNDQVTGAKLNPSLVLGDIIYADGTDTIARLAKGSENEVLTMGGSNAPTWAAVTAGISGHGVVVIKSSDQTVNNSSTLVNDDTLVWALAANKNYRLWMHAFIDTHVSADFKFTVTGPTDCEIHLTMNRNYGAGGSYDWSGLNVLGTSTTMGTPTDTASNWYLFGTIMNSSNAGNLQFQWAQDAAYSHDTKMHNGSWGIMELLN